MRKGSKPPSEGTARTARRARPKLDSGNASFAEKAGEPAAVGAKLSHGRAFSYSDASGNDALTPLGGLYGAMRRVIGSHINQQQAIQVYDLFAEWAATEVMTQFNASPNDKTYAGVVFTELGDVIGVIEKEVN